MLTKYTEYVLKNFNFMNIFFNAYFFSSIIFLVGSPSKRPIPDTTNWDLQMKREWLYKETQTFLDGVFLGTNVSENVIMLDEAYKQGFSCRDVMCGMQFPLHSTRVRY